MVDAGGRQPDVTRLLQEWSDGRREALDRLLPLVYGELRRIARSQLAREQRALNWQPTELVHEAFVRLVDQKAGWHNRAHFYGIAATCMRRLLVDQARRRRAAKRPVIEGGVEITDVTPADSTSPDTIVAVDEALRALEREEPRQAQIAELKFFAGLEIPDIARVVGASPATVKREWAAAKTRLHALLAEVGHDARRMAPR